MMAHTYTDEASPVPDNLMNLMLAAMDKMPRSRPVFQLNAPAQRFVRRLLKREANPWLYWHRRKRGSKVVRRHMLAKCRRSLS